MRLPFDWESARLPSFAMLFFLAGLVATGALFVHSASAAPGDPFPSPLARNHLARVGAGVVLLCVFLALHYRVIEHFARPAYYLGLGVLLAMLAIKAATGQAALLWVRLPWIQLQPSELMKLATIWMLALVLKPMRRPAAGREHLRPLIVAGLPMALIIAQPDLGTALMFPAVLVAMLWVSGIAPKRLAAYVGVTLALAPLALFVLMEHQIDRLKLYVRLDPDPAGNSYQLDQSLLAIGSGGPMGKGLGEGPVNTLGMIPEEHNDFIYSVIGEEWGLLGTLGIAVLYLCLFLSSAGIAYRTRDPFGRLVAVGITAQLAFQAFYNMAMTVGLVPITGVPLPFISFGGSSLFVSLGAMGVILGIGMRPVHILCPDGLRSGTSPVVRPLGLATFRHLRVGG